ncbi:MAG: hypothetical protein AB7T09_30175 [Planctomycetota bacterium]
MSSVSIAYDASSTAGQVLAEVARQARVQLEVEPELARLPLSAAIPGAPWDEVLDAAARALSARVRWRGEALVLGRAPARGPLLAGRAAPSWVADSTRADPRAPRRYLGDERRSLPVVTVIDVFDRALLLGEGAQIEVPDRDGGVTLGLPR